MTLISELIEVPDAVHSGDFVLNLSQGISQIDQTVRDYVVTPELAARFDEALSIIKSALASTSSKAAYLDGSFGSGKSHFMAMLSALLDNNPAARAKEELAWVVDKYDGDVIGAKRYLEVPYHLVGKQSLEEAILGGYLSHVRRLHPDAPLPAVLLDAPLLATAVTLRQRLGDSAFFGLLGKPGETGWGDLKLRLGRRQVRGGSSCATWVSRTRRPGERAAGRPLRVRGTRPQRGHRLRRYR